MAVLPTGRKEASRWRTILSRDVWNRSFQRAIFCPSFLYARCERWTTLCQRGHHVRSATPPAGRGRGRMSGRQHRETELARRIRARGLAAGQTMAQIAEKIHETCNAQFGTTRIKSHRLAHGIALADVIEQVRALFERDGKPSPGIGETLLSAYESGLKRPGPEYLHYLCSVYHVDPGALGYDGPCICGNTHTPPRPGARDPLLGGPELRIVPDPGLTERSHADLAKTSDDEDENVLRAALLKLIKGERQVHLDGQMLGAIENIRRRMDDTFVSASVSPAMLDQWEET